MAMVNMFTNCHQKINTDSYDDANPTALLRNLNLNDLLGLTIAYCDNDDPDGTRDHFIASVTVNGEDNNTSFDNASLFGSLVLGPSATLHIAEIPFEKQINIYPNPFHKTFNVVIPSTSDFKSTTLSIYDLSGRKNKNMGIKGTETTIDTKQLTKRHILI
jgi:Secretion system C-terminal sorting domain/Carbohydrate family 9 binding domain-like